MNSHKPDEIIDLRGLPCPGNLPKVLIKLETMDKGQVLEVMVDDIIALDRIPRALVEEENYNLVSIYKDDENNIHLIIEIVK